MSSRHCLLTLALAFVAHTLSLSASAASETSRFSAFSVGDKLVVTILADTCNTHRGSLRVEPLCRSDRMTRNWAIECSAQLQVFSTRMGCQDRELIPRTLTLSLKQNKVAHEARLLHLEYDGQMIDVQLRQ
jgi:hypothetical protein